MAMAWLFGWTSTASNKQIPEVLAQKVVVPLQAAHFLVDYDNPQGNITLHIAHICAMQVSAWISQHDVFADNPDELVPSYVRGVEHNETDISRMGRYTIHGETGSVLESKIIADFQCTWGVDLFTYLDRLPTGKPVGKLENIYWSSFGLCPELMTKFIYNLHKDYKYQQVPREQILELAKKGISPCLFRLHTKSMEIADRHQFPKGYMMLSPQLMPRSDVTSSTHGYIVCAVSFGDRNEVWIFDANHLAKGPLCQLHHPSLQLGFTLHTAWLRRITKHKANYKIPVKEDYQTLVETNNQDIQKLFEEEIYPHFE